MSSMAKKRGGYLVLLFVLLSVSALALDVVDEPNPDIWAIFLDQGRVTLMDNYSLRNESGNEHPVTLAEEGHYDPDQNKHTFHFRPGTKNNEGNPDNYLKNGKYLFSVSARDTLGNVATQNREFLVNVPELEINMVNPRHGVGNVSEFKVTIETNRAGNVTNESICRFNYNYDIPWTYMEGGFEHLDEPRNSTHQTINNVTAGNVLYVRCKDYYGNSYLQTFDMSHDTTGPVINKLDADPEPIVEVIDSVLKAEVYVQTNENSICKKYIL